MSSKPSKEARKEDRIQQLENELAQAKKTLAQQPKTVRFDSSQVDLFVDQLTERMEWSTNRIVDELEPDYSALIPYLQQERTEDAFSNLIKWVLGSAFCAFGALGIVGLIANWSACWIGGVHNAATIILFLICLICVVIGIDLFREKDRKYIISLFSALVSLAALVVALVK